MSQPGSPPRRGGAAADRLPEMTLVEVIGTDADGDPIARPVAAAPGPTPIIHMLPERSGQPALAPGERVLARLKPAGANRYEGRTFRRVAATSTARVLGVYEHGRITPTDRRHKAEWAVPAGAEGGAQPGEIVLAEPLPAAGPFGLRPARIVQRLGAAGDPRAVSLICIHTHGIPDQFPAAALAEAAQVPTVPPAGRSAEREDLRAIPLVTIDGEDARDFDDAVWAEAIPEGWRVLVAIADVAHHVRPGTALDHEAALRGNSVYFPDRVVPMLPEALSNGWCSLHPGEDRFCLFVEMAFAADGAKTHHRFGRGLMRSAARLTYEQVQAEHDASGHPALFGAYRALLAARLQRGTLELDLSEHRVLLDAAGQVQDVVPRPRLDSHRLIEAFMVAANVCAAEELERRHRPCLYRVHDRPSDAKLDGLRQFLSAFDITLPPGNQIQPRHFAHLLDRVRGTPEERLVNETVLRGQSQAAYSPDNIGHFGLALPRYAHFTSPIRRYADLLVHRALIGALALGDDLPEPAEAARLAETGEHLTRTERRATLAERDAMGRYLAAHMAHRIGEVFEARVSGVTRFGLFVTVQTNNASGMVPLRSLPDNRWAQDEAGQSLVGQRTGLVFSLGQAVEARLAEATPRTGAMVFHLLQGAPPDARPPARRGGRRS